MSCLISIGTVVGVKIHGFWRNNEDKMHVREWVWWPVGLHGNSSIK